ncbi:methionyl-tRNA formyltransferase, mitochondrial isoform X3 [Oreochromis niloticus]|uniref:methionyl-tRNA formyltransferase, mitochondrial isoform X3 n=1 Tax=Oreochromis niloticus TaxID=8128 RepID=UPI000DF41ADE|nr:methionyl-tRNA formyltransferase, mitochondrial isoform X3 [Oreochromis niloticus]
MWTNAKTIRAYVETLKRCQRCCMGTLWRGDTDRGKRQLCRVLSSTSKPKWRLLFFGTDHFAVESLKLLTSCRSTSEGIVETLEVVTLAGDVPVKSGILNVHPSLLPRWRGPAPVFHTILHGDSVTGVSIIQIRPHRFDVGPILNQQLYQVPENCTADELGGTLATMGAHLLIKTLMSLSERMENQREQGQTGATFAAPKIKTSMSWIVWEEQTCDQIDRLYRAVGSRIPLRTMWMGRTIKLLDFTGKCHVSLSDQRRNPIPGSVSFQKDSNTLAVCCKDGWVGFRSVLLKKRLTAADFYNGYLHRTQQKNTLCQMAEGQFFSKKGEIEVHQMRKNSKL